MSVFDLPMPRIVIATENDYTLKYREWEAGDHLLCLGEIENMPGHGVFVDRAGKVHWGHHPDEFRDPTEEEL